MICLDTRTYKACGAFMVCDEAADTRHIAFSESGGERALVKDNEIVFEICEYELVLKSSLFHLNWPMLDNPLQFESLAWQGGMHKEIGGSDWFHVF